MSDDVIDARDESDSDAGAAKGADAGGVTGVEAPVKRGRVYTQRLEAQKRRDAREEERTAQETAALEQRRESVPKDARQWAMYCHFGGLAGYVVPFGGLIAPIILWNQKKDEHEFVMECGREAVNFNITMAALQLVLFVAMFVAMFLFPLMFLLIPAFLVVAVAHVALALTAGLKASDGIAYRYPIAIRFVK